MSKDIIIEIKIKAIEEMIENNKLEKAYKEYMKAINNFKSNMEFMKTYASLLIKKGDIEGAMLIYENILTSTNDYKVVFSALKLYKETGQIENGLKILKKSITKSISKRKINFLFLFVPE